MHPFASTGPRAGIAGSNLHSPRVKQQAHNRHRPRTTPPVLHRSARFLPPPQLQGMSVSFSAGICGTEEERRRDMPNPE